MQDENLYDYNIRKGITPLISGEREKEGKDKVFSKEKSTEKS